ncbi:MAG: hypothetical protein IPJ85_18445 [Flavobacteriales bacterium]|nr:hypothetical protein [Flavobacteriales bacterium]
MGRKRCEASDGNGLPRGTGGVLCAPTAPGDFGYSDKGTTVAAMDVLFRHRRIIGGSQRRRALDVLEARMKEEMHVPAEERGGTWIPRRFRNGKRTRASDLA